MRNDDNGEPLEGPERLTTGLDLRQASFTADAGLLDTVPPATRGTTSARHAACGAHTPK